MVISCAAGVVTGTADRDSSRYRYRYRGNRRTRQKTSWIANAIELNRHTTCMKIRGSVVFFFFRVRRRIKNNNDNVYLLGVAGSRSRCFRARSRRAARWTAKTSSESSQVATCCCQLIWNLRGGKNDEKVNDFWNLRGGKNDEKVNDLWNLRGGKNDEKVNDYDQHSAFTIIGIFVQLQLLCNYYHI